MHVGDAGPGPLQSLPEAVRVIRQALCAVVERVEPTKLADYVCVACHTCAGACAYQVQALKGYWLWRREMSSAAAGGACNWWLLEGGWDWYIRKHAVPTIGMRNKNGPVRPRDIVYNICQRAGACGAAAFAVAERWWRLNYYR